MISPEARDNMARRMNKDANLRGNVSDAASALFSLTQQLKSTRTDMMHGTVSPDDLAEVQRRMTYAMARLHIAMAAGALPPFDLTAIQAEVMETIQREDLPTPDFTAYQLGFAQGAA